MWPNDIVVADIQSLVLDSYKLLHTVFTVADLGMPSATCLHATSNTLVQQPVELCHARYFYCSLRKPCPFDMMGHPLLLQMMATAAQGKATGMEE